MTLKLGADILKNELFEHPLMIDGKEIKLTENKPFKDLVRVPLIKVLIYEAPYELQNKHILQNEWFSLINIGPAPFMLRKSHIT